MNTRLIKTAALLAGILMTTGCSDGLDSFTTPNTEIQANSGTVSQNNFSILAADLNPPVIDAVANTITKTDVDLTVYIGDRNNQVLTDSHTINFVAEYGLVEPFCETEEGSCTVTWSAIDFPISGGPGDDGKVTITAYTIGEEGFTDSNGNGSFDDQDAGFTDIEEAYVDFDESGSFTSGDRIIDTHNALDPAGNNESHDDADGLLNSVACSHTTLCSPNQSTTVFSMVTLDIVFNDTYTIGGTVTIPTGETLTIQNNSTDNLNLTDSDTSFEFTTALNDNDTYNVTELTYSNGTCTITNGMGTVSTANVTDININCP